MRVLFVKQDHASPAGPVGEAFADLGYDIEEMLVVPAERFHDPGVTVSFPDPAAYDAVAAMGAPWSVYDEATVGSWVHAEIAFLRQALAAAVPVLGICFGGQLLATAIGGAVERAPESEIGWRVLTTARPDLVEPGPWFQWHSDRWRLPAGVTAFASTPVAEQAFQAGRTLGLQFHPEATPAMLDGWLANGGAALLASHGIDADELAGQTRVLAADAAGRARALVQRFVRQVAAAPPLAGQKRPLAAQSSMVIACSGQASTASSTASRSAASGAASYTSLPLSSSWNTSGAA